MSEETPAAPAPAPARRHFQISVAALVGLVIVVVLGMGGMFSLGVWLGRGTLPVEMDTEDVGRILADLVEKASRTKEEKARENVSRLADGSDVYSRLEEGGAIPLEPEQPPGVNPVPARPEAAPVSPASAPLPAQVAMALAAQATPVEGTAPGQPGALAPGATQAALAKAAALAQAGTAQAAALSPAAAPPAGAAPQAGEPPAPAPLPPALAPPFSEDTDSRWTIQVAAVTVKKEADKIAEKLSAKGYPAYVVTVGRGPGPTVYRVRVGRFANREDAEKTQGSMSGIRSDSFIVRQ